MRSADETSVKGRFDGRRLRDGDVVSTMFRRDGRSWVRTDGPDGTLNDFEVKYTFGVFPLQQYLVGLPNGRLQALPIAWDTREASRGGQRWFHLYSGQHVSHGDPLHWTGREQNWNFMCADCHSTGVRKNYDPASDSFHTTWAAINVTCEACHGPGSRHVASPRENGLTVQLDERAHVAWTVDPASGKPVRGAPRTTSREIDVCAVCHSRRAQIADGYVPGAALMDYYEPSTIETPLYYADGQQRDEVYVYGSFMQSRMAAAGVTCSDCHDPHTATLRAAGNALCTRCHAAVQYDTPAHHHHTSASTGAACVECHMPARTYMQIDERRDHSLRVPRPDLTGSIGTPDACTACHRDRRAVWAGAAVRGWLGRDARGFQDFARAFDAADNHRTSAVTQLAGIAAAPVEPAIVRASAFDRLAELDAAPAETTAGLRDPDPLVRWSALRLLEAVSPVERILVAVPLLSDPVRAVRIAAARALAPAASMLGDADRKLFDRAGGELEGTARFTADRPESRVAFGVFLTDLGRTQEAETEYRASIRLGSDFAPGYVNLAELLRAAGNETEAEHVLREGVAANPRSADLHYALGLSLTRSHHAADALAELKLASDLAPSVARLAYAYALALHDSGQTAGAIQTLTSALSSDADNRDVLFALVTFERDAGRLGAARQHAARLIAAHPEDVEARALKETLGR
jgi:predicted CXXCH cytochrome family protein